MALLGGIAWIGSHELEPSKPLRSAVTPLRVEIISLDWKWLFISPDQGIATVNQLVVPTKSGKQRKALNSSSAPTSSGISR